MSTTQEGTTLVLASIAVCLVIYAMNKQFQRGDTSVRIVNAVTSVKEALGASRFMKGRFGKAGKKLRAHLKEKRETKKALGSSDLNCDDISPSNPNWARCAQGAGIGRVPSTDSSAAVTSTMLDFAKDNAESQGLGARIQDDFINAEYAQGLGAKLGGMRISNNLQNNAFFSEGTENPTAAVTSGLSTEGAQAFPFASRSDEGAEAVQNTPPQTGPVPGTEAVGMGMNFAAFAAQAKNGGSSEESRGASRQQFATKQVGAEFNPFVQTEQVESDLKLGEGLALSEAFAQKTVGSGLLLEDAFKSHTGAAVSPVSAELGASPEDLAQATAVLKEVNIVQSTTGGQLDFGIRP